MPFRPVSPLHELAAAGDAVALTAAFDALEEKGEERKKLLTWVLLSAIEANQIAAARALLRAGASVNGGVSPRPHIRPLWKAAKHGNVEMVRLLIESGADPQLGDHDGMLPIDYAKRYSRAEVIAYLVSQKDQATAGRGD